MVQVYVLRFYRFGLTLQPYEDVVAFKVGEHRERATLNVFKTQMADFLDEWRDLDISLEISLDQLVLEVVFFVCCGVYNHDVDLQVILNMA
jgi:hypothetical protein